MKKKFQSAHILQFFLTILALVESGTVTSVAFSISDEHCYVGNKNANVVISFTPATTLTTGGVITLHYPAEFLASVAPVVINGGGIVVSAAAPNSLLNVMLLTVTSGSISASNSFTMTLLGLHIKKIPDGSVESVRITTTADSNGTQQGVSTGNCFEGSWSGTCQQLAGLRSSDKTASCSRSPCLQSFTLEFYVGNIRRKFSAMPDNFCFAAASPDAVSAFAFTSASTRGRATDTQLASASNFHPGQRILTITTLNSGVGCYEVWINGTHFIEQGNQKSDSTNYQATSTCPLCHNCASSSVCEGRCNRNGELKCSDPPPVGAGPIEWNYRCTGTRDKLNELQRFLTNEYQIGIKFWKKNQDGTISKEWFVNQASKALLVPIDAVVFLNSREDFFNVNTEGFSVPTYDQGDSDRGLIVDFMVSREHIEEVEKMMLLLGHRLVLRRSLNAVSIRIRPALSTQWQPWQRLMPIEAIEPEAEINPTVPMILFLSCAAIGMIPRSFWRAFPELVRRYTQKAKSVGSVVQNDEEEYFDDDEDKD